MGSPKRNRNNDDTVKRLRQSLPDEVRPEALAQLIHELQVHQEELTAQNTQLIETQQALEETRDRYVNLYDFAPIAFVTISDSGMVREINLTGANLLHRERSRIVGLPFSAFIAASDTPRFTEHLRQCRPTDRVTTTTELELNTGGPQTFVQLVTRRQPGGSNQSPNFLTAIIDITERKRLEQDRREAEEARDKLFRDREITRARADAKDHFLATLSHELRTPLTPIVATITDNRLISLAPEPLHTALQMVRRNLELEVRLIDDLLDVTRISRNRLVLAKERINLHGVLQDVVEMLGHEVRQRGINVTTALSAPMYWVIGDPTRLRQVFWNLLGNAVKFSKVDGHVSIASSAGAEGFVQVRVSDTGAGMDEDFVSSINERAQAAQMPVQSTSGLGLGLAICRGIIAAHGGTLRAMSEGTGRGSTFVVEIPIAAHLEEWDQFPASVQTSGDQAPRPRKILLVEDHQDSADTLSQLLVFHDYDVGVARTMEEAISVANHGVFDLLISDIRLPDGSGLELMRRLQSSHPIRGIAISGFGTEDDMRRSREAGYDTHLTKPVDINRLLDAIERVAAQNT
jgi:PAS domain S-box-containing protein